MRRFVPSVLLVFALWVSARAAFAQKVLLERPQESDVALFEAFGRLRAELELQTFEVEVVEVDSSDEFVDELERLARERDAFAAVALRRSDGGTTAGICLVDRVTGKTTVRKLAIDPSKDGPTLLAVRAVDLLRASLAEFGPGERPPKDVLAVAPAPPPAAVTRFTRPVPPWEVSTGAAVVLTPELGAGVGVRLGVERRFGERLRVGLDFLGPSFGGTFEGEGGVAVVRQTFGWARLDWSVNGFEAGAPFEWGPSLGVGVHHLEATGSVEFPLVARTASRFGALATLGLDGRYRFGSIVSLGGEVGAFGALPRPVVAIDAERSSPIDLQGFASLLLSARF